MSEEAKYLRKKSPERGTELPVSTQNQLGIIKELKASNFGKGWTRFVRKLYIASTLVSYNITLDTISSLCSQLDIPGPSGADVQVAVRKGFIKSTGGNKAIYTMSGNLIKKSKEDPSASELLNFLDS